MLNSFHADGDSLFWEGQIYALFSEPGKICALFSGPGEICALLSGPGEICDFFRTRGDLLTVFWRGGDLCPVFLGRRDPVVKREVVVIESKPDSQPSPAVGLCWLV